MALVKSFMKYKAWISDMDDIFPMSEFQQGSNAFVIGNEIAEQLFVNA